MSLVERLRALAYDLEPVSYDGDTIRQAASRIAELEAALKDWLYFAEETLSEFDVEPCDPHDRLCARCEPAGCINQKFRTARAALKAEEKG